MKPAPRRRLSGKQSVSTLPKVVSGSADVDEFTVEEEPGRFVCRTTQPSRTMQQRIPIKKELGAKEDLDTNLSSRKVASIDLLIAKNANRTAAKQRKFQARNSTEHSNQVPSPPPSTATK